MTTDCDQFQSLIDDGDAIDDARLQEHIDRCPDCLHQMQADRELRHLVRGTPRFALSIHFNQNFRSRLLEEKRFQRHNKRHVLIMGSYWLASGVAIAIVMTFIRWPAQLPSFPVMCALGLFFGVTLGIPAIFFHSMRIGPLELVFETVDQFRQCQKILARQSKRL